MLKVHMSGAIVPELRGSKVHSASFPERHGATTDPLSEIVALLKPQSYAAGGFALQGDIAIRFPEHKGIKCYSMLEGQCWLVLEGGHDPVRVEAGDCFLLPRGLPFQLTTDLSLEPVHYAVARERLGAGNEARGTGCLYYIAGGHFALTGGHAEMLLQALPAVVHIRGDADRAAMRWSLERMREELGDPRPGSSLITQQLAYMMLVQALRLHLADASPGWLSALSDRHMSMAITSMHANPGYAWTLQGLAERVGLSRSVFAVRFREVVGTTPMEYLARWRMMLAAERMRSSSEGLGTIAQSLGYESESAFGKAFRRVMGCSPRYYGRAEESGTPRAKGLGDTGARPQAELALAD